MSDLTALETRLTGLLASLSPSARRRLAADIAKQLRVSQQQRIKRQQAPDGTPYAARKRQPVRSGKGRIKREMFSKLRTSRFMKAGGNDSAAVVDFTGRVQRMAWVHQNGLKDRPNRNGPEVQYPARELLGFSPADIEHVNDIIYSYLEIF